MDLYLHIFDQVHHFITEKRTGQRSTILREVLSQDPYSYKTGSCERGQVLQPIADMLNNVQRPQFKVTSRSIRDRLNSLLSKFKSKTNKELKAGGIEV